MSDFQHALGQGLMAATIGAVILLLMLVLDQAERLRRLRDENRRLRVELTDVMRRGDGCRIVPFVPTDRARTSTSTWH